jgi:hypothetical protein
VIGIRLVDTCSYAYEDCVYVYASVFVYLTNVNYVISGFFRVANEILFLLG